MTEPSNAICKNCRWWRSLYDQYSGECHRHGPGMTSYHRKIGWGNSPEDREIVLHVGWPSTRNNDTCGEVEQGKFPGWELSETFVMDSNMNVHKLRTW